MKQILASALGASIAIGMSFTAPLAAQSARDGTAQQAENICLDEMRQRHSADNFSRVSSGFRQSEGRWQVVGTAERRGMVSARFDCRVRGGSLADLSFPGWTDSGYGRPGGRVENDQELAERVCRSALRRQHGADGFRRVTSGYRESQGAYQVRGTAERYGAPDQQFDCYARGDRVIRLDFAGWGGSGGSYGPGYNDGNYGNNYGSNDRRDYAEQICQDELSREFGARRFEYIRSDYLNGRDAWEVTGTAVRHGDRENFSCVVRRGRITQLDFRGWGQGRPNNGGGYYGNNGGNRPGSSVGYNTNTEQGARQFCRETIIYDRDISRINNISGGYRDSLRQWQFTGYARLHNGQQVRFDCRVQNGNIVSLTYN